jgi:hypothetical protein
MQAAFALSTGGVERFAEQGGVSYIPCRSPQPVEPMEGTDFEPAVSRRPSTFIVLILLGVIAAIFSYIIAFAMANALASAEVIAPWSTDHDPRLRWFAITFTLLAGSCLVLGMLARFISGRQLKSIDGVDEEADPDDQPRPPNGSDT